jgi:tetraacyldisaccharide 4'-kinase
MMRLALRAAEGPYAAAVRWRNRRYDRRKVQIGRVGVPVVSVGNLTLGGTGKTPVVEWIARWFRARGVRVTIISRGYGAEAGAKNDEALELERRLPDVPHLQDPDRVAAAELAIEEFGCQLIVLDDAFQHRRIARDLDVVLLDAREPFGFGHVFPRGTLREPVSGLGRADVVILTRADMLQQADRERLQEEVGRLAPEAIWMEAIHAATDLVDSAGHRRPLDSFKGQRIAAFCGIGNPAGFRHTLETCGSELVGFREFPDHNPYDRGDADLLAEWADRLKVAALVTTAKDLVKLDVEQLGGYPLLAVSIEARFRRGQEDLEGKLASLL